MVFDHDGRGGRKEDGETLLVDNHFDFVDEVVLVLF